MTVAPILVTGAGGFVCSQIALALHDAGHSVVAMDRHFDPATTRRLHAIRRIEGDLPTALSGLSEPVSAVIHGAAITASPEAMGITRAAHIRINTDLLTSALAASRRAGASRFIFLSSMGVFEPDDGPVTGGRFTEATRATADCAYCAAKRAGEVLTAAAAEPGFATLSLRLGNIFGPHEAVRDSRRHLCLAARMLAEARGTGVITVATPEARREWSWLPDLAEKIAGLMVAFPSPARSHFHAGTPPVISDLDLARLIADRVPGTDVRPAAPPHPAIRPPMGSDHRDWFDPEGWTPIANALDALVPAMATP